MPASLKGSYDREARVGNRLWTAGNYILAVLLALMGIPNLAGPLGPNRLDDSWRVDTYLAVLNHLTFGVRYVWTYGPLGFADFPKLVSRHLLASVVVLHVALAAALAALLVNVLTSRIRVHPATATVVIIGLLLPRNFTVGSIEFTAFLCALLLLYIALVDRENNQKGSSNLPWPSRIMIAVAGLLLATAPLVKVSFLPVAAATAALLGMHTARIGSWRALVLLLLPAVMLWFAVFAVAGGGMASGFRWPIAAVPLVGGYTPAMSVQGRLHLLAAVAVVALATAVCAVQALLSRNGNWWFIGAVVLLWLTAFKEGFVRQDTVHVYVPFSLAPWCLCLLWCATRQSGPARAPDGGKPNEPEGAPPAMAISAVVACSLCFFILVANLSTVVRPIELAGFPERMPGLRVRVEGLIKALRFIMSEDYARAELQRQEQNSLDQRTALGLAPLAPILRDQRAFSWPWDGNALLAAHAAQLFPPVPQEYSAYTTSLDEVDARFLSSPGRPPLGLISVEAIDGRLPLQTAGISFVQILSCYQPIALSGAFLVVASTPERGGCPRDLSSGLQWTAWQSVHLDEWVTIPSRPGHITIAQIAAELSNLGRLMNLAFGSAPLRLRMRMPGGKIATFRMVHNTLPDGVMVSSALRDATDLARLWLGTPINDIEAIALETAHPREWHAVLRMRFLEIPVSDPEAEVVKLARSSSPADPATKEHLLQGHVDSVKPAQGPQESDWLWVEGWYDANTRQALDHAIRLAILEAPDRALLIPSYKVPRMDIVRARGPRTPLLCGFTALVPRSLWTSAKGLTVVRAENGDYRIIGILNH